MLSIYVILLTEKNQVHSETIFIVSSLCAKLNNELTISPHQVTNESSADEDTCWIPDLDTMTNLGSQTRAQWPI